jgi:hypothetical protein
MNQRGDNFERGFTIRSDALDCDMGQEARTEMGQSLQDHRIIHMGRRKPRSDRRMGRSLKSFSAEEQLMLDRKGTASRNRSALRGTHEAPGVPLKLPSASPLRHGADGGEKR